METTRPRRPLNYYRRVRGGEVKSPYTEDFYPNYDKACRYCGSTFTVYRLPRSAWPRIDCCCPSCYWMARFSRPYIESMEDFFELGGINWPTKRGNDNLTVRREHLIALAACYYGRYFYHLKELKD
jgi:hypothetical protein